VRVRSSQSRDKAAGTCKCPPHLHLVPRLKNGGAIPPFPHALLAFRGQISFQRLCKVFGLHEVEYVIVWIIGMLWARKTTVSFPEKCMTYISWLHSNPIIKPYYINVCTSPEYVKGTPIEGLHTVKYFWAIELKRSLDLVEQHMYSVRNGTCVHPKFLFVCMLIPLSLMLLYLPLYYKRFFLFFHSLYHSPTHRHSISNQITHPPTPCLRAHCCKQATKTRLFRYYPMLTGLLGGNAGYEDGLGPKNIPNVRCHKIVLVRRCEE